MDFPAELVELLLQAFDDVHEFAIVAAGPVVFTVVVAIAVFKFTLGVHGLFLQFFG